MPRQPIIDAHEWITEISAVPGCRLVNRHPRERSWVCQRGKKTLLSLTLVCCGQQHVGCSIGGNRRVSVPAVGSEIPLLATSLCSLNGNRTAAAGSAAQPGRRVGVGSLRPRVANRQRDPVSQVTPAARGPSSSRGSSRFVCEARI